MITLKADQLTHKTVQGELWDIISLRRFKDEHACHFVQDANFEHRFVDEFPGGIVLQIPPVVVLTNNLKSRKATPDLTQLLPWLSPTP